MFEHRIRVCTKQWLDSIAEPIRAELSGKVGTAARAMSGFAQTTPRVDIVRRDGASWFVAATRPCRHRARNLAFSRRRRRFSCEISSKMSTARDIGRQDACRLAARASALPPASVLTDDATTDKDLDTCEIVQGSDVTLGDGHDTFLAYLVKAIKNNSGVSILFLTDVLGYNNGDSRDFAYRLARFGYNVLVPDLFRGVPWTKERPMDDYEKWRELHSPDRVARDIDVAIEYLVKHFGSTRKLGAIGFCFGGGRMIETLARDTKNRFGTGSFCTVRDLRAP